MKYKLITRSTKAAPYHLEEILESFNMFKGTDLIIISDLALVSTKVKILLYIVGLQAGESFDTSMSTCDGVGAYNRTLENLQDVIHSFTHRRCSGYGQMVHNLR